MTKPLMRVWKRPVIWVVALVLIGGTSSGEAADNVVDFVRDIQPLLQGKCVRCHGEESAKSGLRLDLKAAALAGGDSGAVIVARQSQTSPLMERIRSNLDDKMPPEGEPLSAEQIELFQRWIDQGADWPDGVDRAHAIDKYDWWSLRPLRRPDLPADTANSSLTPVDRFIRAKLVEKGLEPAPEADRRTLARRLYFDLIGLPATPDEMDQFLADQDPDAYARLVDRLLASEHYGERWARHWLDVVHYGDTHGYDKDQPRPNAWLYRDYVIRSLNADKPYSQFIEEQIAGDVIAPGTEDGLTATGFISAGPWDLIGHAEVPETKTDGMIARNLDRDDMVTNTFNTFLSMTVQCARCHNHKFDPVSQEDYYRLQAVFAALDRADRVYDPDPAVATQRAELVARRSALEAQKRQFDARVTELGGDELKQLNAQIAAASRPGTHPLATQFGYHSQIEPEQDRVKWVQVDLGSVQSLANVQIVGCHDDFNQIGAGFGFPVRFKIEVSNQDDFAAQTTVIADFTEQDFRNPGVKPLQFPAGGRSARFIRVTATKLAPRQNDFIFALAELSVFDERGKNLALGRPVRGLDSIEAPDRWRQSNLVDGYYFGVSAEQQASLPQLTERRDELLARVVTPDDRNGLLEIGQGLADVNVQLSQLPAPRRVYAGMVHHGTGTFTGTGPTGGKPRPIRVLARGDVTNPGKLVGPGTVILHAGESGEFALAENHTEGERRLMLAHWISSRENPLTWRSIVNRVWMYHFGRGIVDSPNDFGRMGQLPSHPELLDWLAVEFRDGGQSLKQLHRLIVMSATYRQSSEIEYAGSGQDPAVIDSANVYLWRMNRRKLEAEAVRDAALYVAGKLNPQLGGPAFQDFVVEKPEHSPHYEYRLHDPEDERIHRRSVYRFLVRSQPQPFMATLDCADPSMSVDKRSETVTALQALALLNNWLILTMAKYMAQRVERQSSDPVEQVEMAFQFALTRTPSADERDELVAHSRQYGLVSVCRILMNLNEFVFVD